MGFITQCTNIQQRLARLGWCDVDFLTVDEYREHIQKRIEELSVICKIGEKSYRTRGGYSGLEKQLALQESIALERELENSYLIGATPPHEVYQQAKSYQSSLLTKERERRTRERIEEAKNLMIARFSNKPKDV